VKTGVKFFYCLFQVFVSVSIIDVNCFASGKRKGDRFCHRLLKGMYNKYLDSVTSIHNELQTAVAQPLSHDHLISPT
jgi:hypothetical protein